jgi:hypothetical protein
MLNGNPIWLELYVKERQFLLERQRNRQVIDGFAVPAGKLPGPSQMRAGVGGLLVRVGEWVSGEGQLDTAPCGNV